MSKKEAKEAFEKNQCENKKSEDALKKEIEECKEKLKKLENYAKRKTAEFENYRKEVAIEKQRIIKRANEILIERLIPILDDFERAFKNSDNTDAFKEGVEKIFKKLVRTLENEGLTVIDPENEKFDPFRHEAFERVETEEVDEYTVLEVVEKGYVFHGKVLKPAKVKVAVKPRMKKNAAEKKVAEKTENSEEGKEQKNEG